jgi:hypothetical protein
MSLEQELKKIQGKSKTLKPVRVVEVAKDPSHPLHNRFEWDDQKASHQYRIWQARDLIAKVYVQPFDNRPLQVRAFVSLPSDRVESGYRTIESIMGNEELKAEMLLDAKRQFEILKMKYSVLNELDKIWEAVDKVFK